MNDLRRDTAIRPGIESEISRSIDQRPIYGATTPPASDVLTEKRVRDDLRPSLTAAETSNNADSRFAKV